MLKRNFSLFLALRYLKPKRTFLSIITLISITGVTLGVMVLILVISVMTGFERELERKVVGFDAHVVVSGQGPLYDWQSLQDKIKGMKDVVAIAPFVQGPVLVEYEGRRIAPKIRGIEVDAENQVTDLKQFIKEGSLDLDGDKTILGSALADILGARVGDKITLYSPGNINGMLEELTRLEKEGGKADASALRQMVLPKELEVTGIFESGRYLYDSDYMLVPLFVAQEVYNLGDGVHGLAIRASDRYLANSVRDEINAHLEAPEIALTWMDLNKQIFDAIKMERNVMFFILLFIVLVAAFGIMNTQITFTVQKTREIGIIKALGAQTWQIIGIFFAQGVVIGIFGTLTGLVTGIALVQYRNEVSYMLSHFFNIEVFPREVYQFSEIPAEIVPGDVAIICISAFLICSLAALLPAWFAARLDPVKALRYE